MRRKAITRLLFLLVLLYALAMTFPLGIALFLSEGEMIAGFGITMALCAAAAFPALMATRGLEIRFSARDGFMLVFLAWVAACLTGALPYVLSGRIPHFADAVFESVSGFTTTGTSIINDLEIMPRSLIFWRAETHWLGGMGMVVLTVALLPFLGVGGFQLLKAEITGPDKERITPKITETAKILWLIYITLTALETALLVIAGMSWFDAVTHAFSTMATGGFSSRNEGLAYWNSPAIVWIVTVFMIIAGFNFSLIFRLLQRKWKDVYYNSEARAYGLILLISVTIGVLSFQLSAETIANARQAEAAAGIGYGRPLTSIEGSIRTAFFYTASILTTTGLTAGGQALLTSPAKAILFLLMFIGGCSGSTAGGIKVVRHVVLLKQTENEMKKILYPRGVFSIRLNNKVGRKDVVYGVAGFIFLYFFVLVISALIVASSGLGHLQSFSVALISQGNIGLDPAMLDQVRIFVDFPDYVKWTLSFVMLAGRLELWTALVFFSRDYWR
ncbi:MAG: TrkH family potassium uptake protein [Treponema sp.]|jgi:trk system potassium uptake protein TrkH|nr:TrkH family potassium uptake protein [Treponema sp.]